jgi:hypothetical protein
MHPFHMRCLIIYQARSEVSFIGVSNSLVRSFTLMTCGVRIVCALRLPYHQDGVPTLAHMEATTQAVVSSPTSFSTTRKARVNRVLH